MARTTILEVGRLPRTRKCRSLALRWTNWKNLRFPSSSVAITLPTAIAAMTAQRRRLRAEGFPDDMDFVLVPRLALKRLLGCADFRSEERRVGKECGGWTGRCE